ncbi:MAG: helix-turn-helix domain-containing protein [Roseburia sp.]|uniref:helix-turn-helix transcriptional regulator n=1 Tax=Roseburia sp. 831b TaxID=1261635 RepID=UPI000951DCAF|nr:helix-turn-helix domain-containing protein [Roseburia sp. 831b]MCI5919812.1 helix-turn-helix domain-containing protein [Roseburia sp.]MDY5884216.1 helix-turn-helix domain-containing protein [Roseburia sp.]WVK73763.1 helix-turn-helix domain-containing protein [Roseburia sp. 831b]
MNNRLQEIRWKKGWSLERLARESSVSKTTICTIENKTNLNPSVEVAFKLADALEVDVRELFYW